MKLYCEDGINERIFSLEPPKLAAKRTKDKLGYEKPDLDEWIGDRWHTQPAYVADFARWLIDHEECDGSAVQGMLLEPRNWQTEWRWYCEQEHGKRYCSHCGRLSKTIDPKHDDLCDECRGE